MVKVEKKKKLIAEEVHLDDIDVGLDMEIKGSKKK